MAMAANSSVSNHSPTSSPSSVAAAIGGGDGGASSPSSRRRFQSPWSQVVRGMELESSSGATAAPRSPTASLPIPAVDSFPPENDADVESSAPEAESNDNAAGSKKPVWRKPSNGVVEGTSVMGGAISWPALSESTRLTGKTSPADSSSSTKPVLDGSTPISQGPIIAQTPQKPPNTNNNANANHGLSRQRSMRNRGAAQSGISRPMPSPPTPPPMPPPLPFPSNDASFVSYGNFVPPPVLDSSMRGARPVGGVVGPPAGNDHSTHTHSSRNARRNNFGGRPRGDGQYHGGRRDHDRRDGQYHGGRRDHDRREGLLPHGPPQFAPPPPGSYMPPPPPSPGSAPFIPPPPLRPFVPPMGYDMPPHHPFLYVPTLPPYMAPPPPPPMFFPPVVDPPRSAAIVNQIDYYFSDSNLVKDNYLRSFMDDEGWVRLDLIADFPRVQQLKADIPFILESLQGSMVVEIKEGGDKVRRRNDWRKWIHTGSSHVSPKSGPQVSGTSPVALSNSINRMSLDEGTSNGNGGALDSGLESARSRPSPDDSSSPNDPSVTGSSIMANGDASPEELHANSS